MEILKPTEELLSDKMKEVKNALLILLDILQKLL